MKPLLNKNVFLPHCIIDDWYTEEELKMVKAELNYYYSVRDVIMKTEEEDKSMARDEDGKAKGKFYRIFTYTNPHSITDKLFTKVKNDDVRNAIKTSLMKDENYGLYELLMTTNIHSTAVTYYGRENDEYKEHIDSCTFTVLIWLFNEPKKFEGGNLVFIRTGETIEIKNNRMLLFPGFYKHRVEPIRPLDGFQEDDGRWTISHFFLRNEVL